MSLSSHLRDKRSPVRHWLEDHFPNTREVATLGNASFRDLGACAICPPPNSDLGLVGTAVDYLLRACLRRSALERTAATVGAFKLSALRDISDRSISLERGIVAQIAALDPSSPGELHDNEWRRLCELCLLLARFEQFRRNPHSPAVQEKVAEPLARYNGAVLGLVPAMNIEEPSIDDLFNLGRAAWQDTADLQDADPLYLNPRFDRSLDLGGADADLIYGDTLLDWKSNTRPDIVGRFELWQLLGYALADTEDEFEIQRVEIGALRWRVSVSWPLEELTSQLSAGRPETLSELRRSFAMAAVNW